MCISQWTQTPDKVFHKLLMPFHMQKKILGLQRNQIFNQGSFFSGSGGVGVGGCKAIWRIVPTSEKILATPLFSKIDINMKLDPHGVSKSRF